VEVDGSAVLVRYVLAGDADLDGEVGFSDLVRLAQNYNDSGRTWSGGDFDYDGSVGFTDLVRLAQNYGSPLPAAGHAWTAEFAGDWARAAAAVPEPMGLGGLCIAGAAAALRRGRSTSARSRAERSR
jgi:hypothetical protein